MLSSKKYTLPVLLLLVSIATSCKKNKDDYGNPAVLQLFNMMDDGLELRTNFTGQHPIRYSSSLQLANKLFWYEFATYIKQSPQPLALYAIPDTLEKDQPVLNLNLELDRGSIYSLFVYGNKPAAAYLLNKDVYATGKSSDSLTFIRFVNLIADQKISVNLKNKPVGSAAANIDFRQITSFEGYKVDRSVTEYEFEIRDQLSGDLITTYTTDGITNQSFRSLWFNKPNSLVFVGKKNGTGVNAPKIVLIQHSL